MTNGPAETKLSTHMGRVPFEMACLGYFKALSYRTGLLFQVCIYWGCNRDIIPTVQELTLQ